MEKRKIIIMTIISTIISLVMILCSYFGVTRYYLLRFQSSESYIATYPTIRKTETKTTVAISTTPKRIEKIRPMINSILDQTVRVDRIILVVDQNAIDGGYTLPPYLNNIAILFPTGKDYGPGCCNSMIPMLLSEKECDTTIISLLDDVIYGKDYLEMLILEGEKYKGRAIQDKKHTSIMFKPEYYDCTIINRDKGKYTDEWFLKNSITLDYGENYKV